MVGLTSLLKRLDKQGGVNLLLADACRDDPGRGRGVSGNELEGRLPSNTAVLFSCAARQQAFYNAALKSDLIVERKGAVVTVTFQDGMGKTDLFKNGIPTSALANIKLSASARGTQVYLQSVKIE